MLSDGFREGYTTIPFAYYKFAARGCESGFVAHHHKELEIIALVEGEADFYIDSTAYGLRSGDVLIIPPYCVHRAVLYPNSSYDCACFDLSLLWDGALCKELEQGALTVRDHLHASAPFTPLVHSCVRSAVAACEERAEGWEMNVIGNLSIVFSKLKETSFFVSSHSGIKEHAFCKSVLDYVATHYAEPITSGTAASSMYINNSYFCRLFKSSFGCCFSEYLCTYRIEKAKLCLNNTDLSVSEIAIRTGFRSFSYFSKVFKGRVGVRPSDYRAN